MTEHNQTKESQSPSGNVGNVLEEARMILPGVQTLFGFQLIVVFNDTFRDRLVRTEQYAHLLAMALTVIATATLMTPALYHRRVEPHQASQGFVRLASRLLLWSSVPLALALCLDFYLVASLITTRTWASLLLAGSLFIGFCWLWYVFPARQKKQ